MNAAADPLWEHIRREAEEALTRDSSLTELMLGAVLNRGGFEEAVAHRVAARLAGSAMEAGVILDAFLRALALEPELSLAFRADIAAYAERDPACLRLLEPLLYFKGFHAIEAHRFAHVLWREGRTDFALYLQSRTSDALSADVHPAAQFGRGVFLDHATGFVVGETAVIEDGVSILHNVTLGGTGKEAGDRHPKVRSGVMIGAGAKILGNIEIGACARVTSGSVVLRSAPRNAVLAGVPAKVVDVAHCAEPARDMDQILAGFAYESFDYAI